MLALVLRTFVHFFRLLLPVALGVAVSSAVIVGALLVGDSMRGSLQHIALDRHDGSISPLWSVHERMPKTRPSAGCC